MTIDVVMPARNEAPTVAANVAAALGCRHARRVIVVDDGSTDGTADIAAAAGAHEVVRRESPSGSKARAMARGLEATDAEAVLFVDADCVGLTSGHLDEICRPFVEGRATMSVGCFDYGRLLNAVMLRCPPISGERVVPRWVFDEIPPEKLDGYTIETRINGVVAHHRQPTTVRTMRGVHHRTKRQKMGFVAGYRATLSMFVDLFRLAFGDVPVRSYWWYLRGLTVER